MRHLLTLSAVLLTAAASFGQCANGVCPLPQRTAFVAPQFGVTVPGSATPRPASAGASIRPPASRPGLFPRVAARRAARLMLCR